VIWSATSASSNALHFVSRLQKQKIIIKRDGDLQSGTKCSIINLVTLTLLVIEIPLKHNEAIIEHTKDQMVFITLLCIA
jgi:hypothetical protein